MLKFIRTRAKPSYITLADRARDVGEWDRAAAYYHIVLRRNPKNSPIWVQYGHVLKESGRLAEARQAYKTAVLYDPQHADPHLQLGRALKIEGRTEEAQAAFLQSLVFDPSLESAWLELAQLGWTEAHFSDLHGILGREVPPRPPLATYLRLSEQVPGFTRGEETVALALASLSLPDQPNIVQIGTFMGSAAILLAGARRLRGSGIVHCVDPFDCSGDDFSVPYYRGLLAEAGGGSLRAHFERNIQTAGLEDWIEVHQGRAEEVADGWTASIDMLVLCGDQSPAGARAAYQGWSPFLKPGGIIVIYNSSPREYDPTHDGNRRIVVEEIVPPIYTDVGLVGYHTFARRTPD